MTAITVTAANISANEERGAVLKRYIAGEALTIGQAVYLDSSNPTKAYKAVSDSANHARAVGIVVFAANFYGETTIASGDYATVCVGGPVEGFSGLTNGQPLWVDSTAGGMNDTAPTGGTYQFIVGHAIGYYSLFVDPGTADPVSHA